jgi:hypothetical protein
VNQLEITDPAARFDWDALAARVETRGFPGIAETMRGTSGPERCNIARDAADNLMGRPGTERLQEDLRAAAWLIRMGV